MDGWVVGEAKCEEFIHGMEKVGQEYLDQSLSAGSMGRKTWFAGVPLGLMVGIAAAAPALAPAAGVVGVAAAVAGWIATSRQEKRLEKLAFEAMHVAESVKHGGDCGRVGDLVRFEFLNWDENHVAERALSPVARKLGAKRWRAHQAEQERDARKGLGNQGV